MATGKSHGSCGKLMESLSERVTHWAGTTNAFILAIAVVVVWAILGPAFQFSNTWQLVINTGTTIVTVVMVFLIQRTQNKDALAIHLKLNEIVAAMEGASNRLIDAESLSEKDLQRLEKYYAELTRLAKKDAKITDSHSIEEARATHSDKQKQRGR